MRSSVRAAAIVGLLASASSSAQDRAAPEAAREFMACDDVQGGGFQRAPAVRVDAVPDLPPAVDPPLATRTFTFERGPLRSVTFTARRVAVAGTPPVSRGTWPDPDEPRAQFRLWIETVREAGDPAAALQRRVWEIVDERGDDDGGFYGGISGQADSDAAPTGDGFAQIAPGVALFQVAFNEIIAGRTTQSTSQALLVDLRGDLPRVPAANRCESRDSIGACLAFDTSSEPRASRWCTWDAAAEDLLCADGGKGRRFYASSDRIPSRPAGEEATIADALRILQRTPAAQPVVYGLGPVSLLRRVTSRGGRTLSVLLVPHGFLVVPEGGPALWTSGKGPSHPDGEWHPPAPDAPAPLTSTARYTHRTRVRHVAGDLTVLEVALESAPPLGARYIYDPSAKDIHWIGIEDGRAGLIVDSMIVATEAMVYDRCMTFRVPESIVQVGAIGDPFVASVVVQPPHRAEGEGTPVSWAGTESDDAPADCLRAATVRWTRSGFATKIAGGPCRVPGKPRIVRIDGEGRIRLVEPPPPFPFPSFEALKPTAIRP